MCLCFGCGEKEDDEEQPTISGDSLSIKCENGNVIYKAGELERFPRKALIKITNYRVDIDNDSLDISGDCGVDIID